MTQIKHISAKEMRRRTGTNAMGYTYPDKDTILLRKGLTGELKRKVLDHEIEHMENGEEGPFLPALMGLGASLIGSSAQAGAARDDRAMQERNLAQSRGDLSPYREFGTEQLGGFQDWLASTGGRYADPTMEEVQASPGYATRLGAIENSAAGRGGLFSGNALRDIGEFGASEYDRTRGRKRENYMDEYNRRMGRVNLGYGAAGGSAGLTSAATPGMSSTYSTQGKAYGDMGSALAGAAGEYAGNKRWNQYLDRAYPKPKG